MSTQQEYIEKQGWHYIGTQDQTVYYFKDGKLHTIRLSQVLERIAGAKSKAT